MDYDIKIDQFLYSDGTGGVAYLKHNPETNQVEAYDENFEFKQAIDVPESFGTPQVDPESLVQDSLRNAIYLAQNSPYDTPEEHAIVDNTVALALADFRTLASPTAQTTKLATDLLSWRIA